MHKISDFAIDLRLAATDLFIELTAVYAATDDAAVDVLIDGGAVHQSARES